MTSSVSTIQRRGSVDNGPQNAANCR